MAVELLRQLNQYDITNFVPVVFKKKTLGWINRSNDFNLPFSLNSISKINFKELIRFSQRTCTKKFREFCPIFYFNSLEPRTHFNHNNTFCDSKIFYIERDFLSKFGLPAYGVHCNVWSKYKNSTIIHLAKRANNLQKFPGMYDNLIAGGQPIKISIKENLYKEAFEEAGLEKKHMKLAVKTKTAHYIHNEKQKLNSSIIFIYQLEKKEEMKFKNIDGEVENFTSIEVDNLYKILEKKKLKPNCIIPIIDFFISKRSDFISKKVILEIKNLMQAYD